MGEMSYETLLESLFEGVYHVDRGNRITSWNKAAEAITGYKRSEVLGVQCTDDFPLHVNEAGQELVLKECFLSATLIDGKVREANAYLRHKQGHLVPVSLRTTPIKSRDGTITGGIEVFIDNSYFHRMFQEYEKIKKGACVDGLTQVSNRRYIEITLHTWIYELRTFKVPFGVIFLDIDHFKELNDTYSHTTGDIVLQMVARTIINVLRKLDTVCRCGGEEFVVVLPNITDTALTEVAERIRTFIEQSYITVKDEKLSVTVSLGATMANLDDTPESILNRAEGLMRESKIAGRNKLTIG